MSSFCFSCCINKSLENSTTERNADMADLNIRQDKFLKALLEAGSIDEACRAANINRTTGYKYLKDPIFMEEYRAIRREAMQQVTARLQKKSEEAVEVLAEIMLDGDAPTGSRVQSAKNVLDVAYRSLELDDIQLQIDDIKTSLEQGSDD